MRPFLPLTDSGNVLLSYTEKLGDFRCALAGVHRSYLANVQFCKFRIGAHFSSYLSAVNNSVETVLGGSRPPNVLWVNAPLSSLAADMSSLVRFGRRMSMYFFASRPVHKARSILRMPSPVSPLISGKRPRQALVTREGYNLLPKEIVGVSIKRPSFRWVSVGYPSLIMCGAPFSSKLKFAASFNSAYTRILFRHKIASSLSLATGYHYVS